MCSFVVALFALSVAQALPVSAQSQAITVTPGYVNLGMTTTVVVTAPSSGQYTVVVVQPNGGKSSIVFAFTSAGEQLNATYGNSTVGFQALVDQTGTYNVFLEQGSQVVSSTAFYATDKLLVSMDMVNGGDCAYIAGATRGTKMFPRFYIYFESTGAPLTNLDPGAYVTYTLPDGGSKNATWDRFVHLYVGKVQPDWNYTSVGPWNPAAVIGDSAGNSASFMYTGNPYDITPVTLDTSLAVLSTGTGDVVTTLANGVGVTIQATITYPTNAEPVPGFVGPLDSSARGGTVTAQVGWGYYNSTSGTFGGAAPGGLLGTVLMTYTGSNGTWTGQFESNNLPKLQAGATYVVVVASHDAASPANTGFASEALSPGSATSQTTSSTTNTSNTGAAPQPVQTIPSVVYAALAILLVLGVIIGYIVRVPR